MNKRAPKNQSESAQIIAPEDVRKMLSDLFAQDMHARRVLSLANGVIGAVYAVALSIHAIGQGLAMATGVTAKAAIKQVDRLLSNNKLVLWEVFEPWVRFVIGERTEIVCALDWTEFDDDDHATIALHIITSHGRATPLMWKTHPKSSLAQRRNLYEDELLKRFREILPGEVRAIILADRAFGDQALYQSLAGAHLDFVIRFRGNILVESSDGEGRTGAEWVPSNGQARKLEDARVTSDKTPVAAVVCTKARGMKDAWCLASSLRDRTGSEIVKLYGHRFSIEENFRDTKDLRFGMGLSATHIGRCDRRDRLLLIAALAQALLTLLGAAAEDCGLDRTMKANTVKRRTHSLFRQGCFWYASIPAMPQPRLELLMRSFHRILAQHAVFQHIFGVI